MEFIHHHGEPLPFAAPFNDSFLILDTYAVVVAPNTKRETAADLKCTILMYGLNNGLV